MSVQQKAGMRRQQIVLHVLLFSTGFLGSALGLLRWGDPLWIRRPRGPSERRMGSDGPPPTDPAPKIAAFTTQDAAPSPRATPPAPRPSALNEVGRMSVMAAARREE